ncbi:MAG: hypothetical protein HYR85_17415 [Planctomycetes bacterium]|nr:hypothetical protein [Planctomycetota bacterium]MBI3843441.1 hypothetical protein [Planctomycetota bacterium]
MNRLAAAVALVSVAFLPACASLRPGDDPQKQSTTESGQDAAKTEEEGKAEKKHTPLLLGILLYLPNRVIDLFDVVRFGVDVGPGFGVEGEVTEALQAGVMTRTSVGAGFQTLRHLPVKIGAETYAAVGPLAASPTVGLPWYRNKWDVRAEAHVAIIGAHVAINPAEILDFVLGFLTIDLMDDDL